MHEPLTTQLVAEKMQELLTAFPSRHASQNIAHTAEVYRNGLRGITGESFRAAADIAIKTDSYFPKIARLRELAGEWTRRNRADAAIVAHGSWDVCPVCGARAELKAGERPIRDFDKPGAPIVWDGVDQFGQPKPKMEPAPARWTMLHNPAAHGVHAQQGESTDAA